MILEDHVYIVEDKFLISVRVWRYVTFKLGCSSKDGTVFHLLQTNFASYEESTGSPVKG